MSADRIRELNDQFRKDPLRLGRPVITRSLVDIADGFPAKALKAVQEFTAFENGQEHDLLRSMLTARRSSQKLTTMLATTAPYPPAQKIQPILPRLRISSPERRVSLTGSHASIRRSSP